MKRLAGVTFVLAAALILLAADLTGTWSANVVLDAGNGTATFKLMQMGDTLSGTYSGVLGDAKVTGTVKGNQVEWSFQSDQTYDSEINIEIRMALGWWYRGPARRQDERLLG